MIESFILIESKISIESQNFMISLACAKQVVIGNVPGARLYTVLYIVADSSEYLNKALADFSKIENVTSVITLFIRQQ